MQYACTDHGETNYLDILNGCLQDGERKENRTGVDTFVLKPQFWSHDMKLGFPLMTTKKVAKRSMLVELEGFIGGITDKVWYQDRKCKVWNQWSNPDSRPAGTSQEDWYDLGPIYGYQWRRFNNPLSKTLVCRSLPMEEKEHPEDQLAGVVRMLKDNPNDRRMICSAWNPQQIHQMALPPCHVLFNLQHINGKLNLHWHQRSCDMFLGVPFNIASYAMLLTLLAKEAGMEADQLSCTLVDCHIYENHLDQIREQISRQQRELPTVEFGQWTDIYDWTHQDVKWVGYNPHPAIKAPVAV